jgi:hypothetical protein
VSATLGHDTAGPVEGCAALQLHTHAVIFNVTERESGQARALQPWEMCRLAALCNQRLPRGAGFRLHALGYELERGNHGQPESKRG